MNTPDARKSKFGLIIAEITFHEDFGRSFNRLERISTLPS